MNKKEWVKKISSLLDHFFPHPCIPLFYKDPYTLLIATLLSAQCTDRRVNEVTPSLFALADTPEKMAVLPLEALTQLIRPCGLYQRKARAILALSKILVEQYQGNVPSSLVELEALPGVGHKTASVVLVQAFHIPAFPVDTHIHRCAKRWGLSRAQKVEETEKDLKRLFPKEQWGKVHLQIIHFARTHCPSRAHIISLCPICRLKNL